VIYFMWRQIGLEKEIAATSEEEIEE